MNKMYGAIVGWKRKAVRVCITFGDCLYSTDALLHMYKPPEQQ
jgi:hypothetical protein